MKTLSSDILDEFAATLLRLFSLMWNLRKLLAYESLFTIIQLFNKMVLLYFNVGNLK